MTEALDRAFRNEWPRVLAALVRFTGSVDMAEEAVAEAFARAITEPDVDNPGAWVTTVAKRIALDAMRRDTGFQKRMSRLAESEREATSVVMPDDASPTGDDRLDLLLVAASPDLPAEDRLAVALRFVCGLPTVDIAHALLVPHSTMSARLTRAKRRIDARGIRFSAEGGLASRLPDMLAVIYVLFTVGHTAPTGDEFGRPELTAVAIDLCRALRRSAPDPEVAGLLALMLLTEARRATRAATLEFAHRSLWNRRMITEGLELATEALAKPGRYGFEAAVSGLHATAASWDDTDWAEIVTMYDRLVELWPSPSAKLARTIARSYLHGPAAVIDELDDASASIAVRADLLRRMGRGLEARAEYARAAGSESNRAVRSLLERRANGL